jgi:hypothetical protein
MAQGAALCLKPLKGRMVDFEEGRLPLVHRLDPAKGITVDMNSASSCRD